MHVFFFLSNDTPLSREGRELCYSDLHHSKRNHQGTHISHRKPWRTWNESLVVEEQGCEPWSRATQVQTPAPLLTPWDLVLSVGSPVARSHQQAPNLVRNAESTELESAF